MSLSQEIGDGVPLGIKLKDATGDVIANEVHAARERANRDAARRKTTNVRLHRLRLGLLAVQRPRKGRRPEHSRIGLNTCGFETNCIKRASGLNPNIGRPSGKEMPLTNVFTGDDVDTYEQVFAR